MKYGLFMMPSHPPERNIYDAHQWDLQYLTLCDELGFRRSLDWRTLHLAVGADTGPGPADCPGFDADQAHQVGVGRAPCCRSTTLPSWRTGLPTSTTFPRAGSCSESAPAALPSDWALFDVDGNNGEHRDMTRESLDIILKIWANDGPFEYKGKYWNVSIPEPMYGTLEFFLRPYQQPHPPIGVASVSYKSPTLMIAGERGFIPMSLALNADYCRSHWEAIEEGAQRTGKTPSRADWRLVRDVYVADTDEEARDLALNGMLGRVWHDYLLPLFREFDLMKVFKHDDEVPDEAVNIEYMADHLWLIGSPDTVAEKIRSLYQDVGGFGGLLMLVYDQSENNAAWEHSTRLLAENVMPRVSDLTGAGAG